MHLVGRVADIVSMIPTQATGEWSVKGSLADSTLDRIAEKSRWVREGAEAAVRKARDVELHTTVFPDDRGDDVGAALAKESADTDVPGSAMEDSTLYVRGTGSEVRDRLRHWRDRAGITYVSLFNPGEGQIEYLAEEVVAPLVEG